MKRYLCLLLALSVLLCGCGKEVSAPDSSSVSGIQACVDNTVYYTTVSEFLESDFCDTMKEKGFTPYLLSYDESRYEFSRMSSDADFYEFHLMDTETDSSIIITITYDSYFETAEDFAVNKTTTDGDIITTVEKDGQTYDVYISKMPYTPDTCYSIGYIPFPDYKLSLHSNRATPEAVLEDFQAFTLITQEEWENAH